MQRELEELREYGENEEGRSLLIEKSEGIFFHSKIIGRNFLRKSDFNCVFQLKPSLARKIRTQKWLSRNQRLKSPFLTETFSTHSRQKFPSVSFKERRTLELITNSPAHPFDELIQSGSADGRAGSNMRPDGRAGTIVLFSSRPQSSSPKIVSNSLLFRLD